MLDQCGIEVRKVRQNAEQISTKDWNVSESRKEGLLKSRGAESNRSSKHVAQGAMPMTSQPIPTTKSPQSASSFRAAGLPPLAVHEAELLSWFGRLEIVFDLLRGRLVPIAGLLGATGAMHAKDGLGVWARLSRLDVDTPQIHAWKSFQAQNLAHKITQASGSSPVVSALRIVVH